MRENNQRRNPFLLAPALVLPAVFFFGIVSFIFSEPLGSTAAYILSALFFLFIFGLPIALFFCLRGGKWLSSCLLPVKGRSIALSLGAALLMIAQSTFLRSLAPDFFDYRTYTLYGISFFAEADSFGAFAVLFFALVLIPALTEGILFRGILMYEYRFGGALFSVLVSSFLYAALSMNPIAFPPYFLNGILLSATAFITGNLFCSVFAHVIFLLFAMFGEKYLLFLASETETRMILFFVLAGIGIASVVFICDAAEKILRVRGEQEHQKPIVSPKRKRFIVFWDMISAPLLWADFFCFAVFSILHLFI
ncbi:MAG: CPBP family intramembrane metalloprotease [Clostridia bacterium]|nr:CPBP family intramembrane metalloprotease [Clostridia bacterium]